MLFATRRSSTNFMFTSEVARLLKYPFRAFIPHSSKHWFDSTPCVVPSLAAKFAATYSTEPLLACDFTRALACTFLYAALQSTHVLSASAQSS